MITIGHFDGPTGIKGWLKVRSYTANREDIFDYQPWHVSASEQGKIGGTLDQQLVHFDQWGRSGKHLTVHIIGIDDINIAMNYKGYAIQVDTLPPLKAEDYYWHELIGMDVYHLVDRVYFGQIKQFIETGANDVMVVSANARSYDQEERLIPWVLDQYIVSIDRSKNEVIVDWDIDF